MGSAATPTAEWNTAPQFDLRSLLQTLTPPAPPQPTVNLQQEAAENAELAQLAETAWAQADPLATPTVEGNEAEVMQMVAEQAEQNDLMPEPATHETASSDEAAAPAEQAEAATATDGSRADNDGSVERSPNAVAPTSAEEVESDSPTNAATRSGSQGQVNQSSEAHAAVLYPALRKPGQDLPSPSQFTPSTPMPEEPDARSMAAFYRLNDEPAQRSTAPQPEPSAAAKHEEPSQTEHPVAYRAEHAEPPESELPPLPTFSEPTAEQPQLFAAEMAEREAAPRTESAASAMSGPAATQQQHVLAAVQSQIASIQQAIFSAAPELSELVSSLPSLNDTVALVLQEIGNQPGLSELDLQQLIQQKIAAQIAATDSDSPLLSLLGFGQGSGPDAPSDAAPEAAPAVLRLLSQGSSGSDAFKQIADDVLNASPAELGNNDTLSSIETEFSSELAAVASDTTLSRAQKADELAALTTRIESQLLDAEAQIKNEPTQQGQSTAAPSLQAQTPGQPPAMARQAGPQPEQEERPTSYTAHQHSSPQSEAPSHAAPSQHEPAPTAPHARNEGPEEATLDLQTSTVNEQSAETAAASAEASPEEVAAEAAREQSEQGLLEASAPPSMDRSMAAEISAAIEAAAEVAEPPLGLEPLAMEEPQMTSAPSQETQTGAPTAPTPGLASPAPATALQPAVTTLFQQEMQQELQAEQALDEAQGEVAPDSTGAQAVTASLATEVGSDALAAAPGLSSEPMAATMTTPSLAQLTPTAPGVSSLTAPTAAVAAASDGAPLTAFEAENGSMLEPGATVPLTPAPAPTPAVSQNTTSAATAEQEALRDSQASDISAPTADPAAHVEMMITLSQTGLVGQQLKPTTRQSTESSSSEAREAAAAEADDDIEPADSAGKNGSAKAASTSAAGGVKGGAMSSQKLDDMKVNAIERIHGGHYLEEIDGETLGQAEPVAEAAQQLISDSDEGSSDDNAMGEIDDAEDSSEADGTAAPGSQTNHARRPDANDDADSDLGSYAHPPDDSDDDDVSSTPTNGSSRRYSRPSDSKRDYTPNRPAVAPATNEGMAAYFEQSQRGSLSNSMRVTSVLGNLDSRTAGVPNLNVGGNGNGSSSAQRVVTSAQNSGNAGSEGGSQGQAEQQNMNPLIGKQVSADMLSDQPAIALRQQLSAQQQAQTAERAALAEKMLLADSDPYMQARQTEFAAEHATSVIDVILKKAYGKERDREKDAGKFVALVLRAHGFYTYEHSTRLIDLACELAEMTGRKDEATRQRLTDGILYKDLGEVEYMLSKGTQRQRDSITQFLAGVNLAQAGMLHDIGKIKIPKEILYKPGMLTPDEARIMQMHPIYGAQILESIPPLRHAAPAARHHHERYDGKGYPDRLKGEAIPFEARVIAVVDTFDAMAADRPYRKGLPLDVCRSELLKGRGKQFDPALVEAFMEVLDKKFVRERMSMEDYKLGPNA